METITITEDQTGCFLDNHRGHYITRDAIQLAEEYGFITGGFEKFALAMYEDHGNDSEYPFEELDELCTEATAWLNSGQDKCHACAVGSGDIRPGQVPMATVDGKGHVNGTVWVICKDCSGTGRGPREAGQNFPPKVPEGYTWAFEDGDFGLWKYDDEGEFVIDEGEPTTPEVEHNYVLLVESLDVARQVHGSITVEFKINQRVKFRQPNGDTGIHTITEIGRDSDQDVWIKVDDGEAFFDWYEIIVPAFGWDADAMAAELEAAGWPAVAGDARDGLHPETILRRLREINEADSSATEIVAKYT